MVLFSIMKKTHQWMILNKHVTLLLNKIKFKYLETTYLKSALVPTMKEMMKV